MDIDDQDTGRDNKGVDDDTTTNPEDQDTGQSNKDAGGEGDDSQDTGGSKLYKTPDNRDLSADELYEEYKKLIPEFTRRSQRLSELEKLTTQKKSEADASAREQLGKDERIKDVPRDVQEAIISIISPYIERKLTDLERTASQKEADRAYDQKLTDLEKRYIGKEGLPKFDRQFILAQMQRPGNQNFDPESFFREFYRKEFMDFEIKQALKKQRGGRMSEKTGQSSKHFRKDLPSPKTFAEASKRALSRILGDES